MLLTQGTTNSNLARIMANLGGGGEGSKCAKTVSLSIRLQRFSKASDCAGPHNHGEFLCVSRRMGSVIEAKFGTKRTTVLINPRNLLALVALVGGCICLIAWTRSLSGDTPSAEI